MGINNNLFIHASHLSFLCSMFFLYRIIQHEFINIRVRNGYSKSSNDYKTTHEREMQMKQRLIQVWGMLDSVYYFCTHLQCLEQITGNTNVFRVRLTRYKGREVVLSDGTLIKKNDLLVKIHLHNVRILKEMQCIDENFKKSLFLYKKVQASLPDLAFFIIHHNKNDQIKGIIGITMIDKGYKRLGFESFSLSSHSYLWFKRIAHYPIHLLSSSKPSSKGKKMPTPQYLFMSKDSICKKYGTFAKNIA